MVPPWAPRQHHPVATLLRVGTPLPLFGPHRTLWGLHPVSPQAGWCGPSPLSEEMTWLRVGTWGLQASFYPTVSEQCFQMNISNERNDRVTGKTN